MIVFDDIWTRAQKMPMDDAVCRLEGLLDLIQHHPALAPEVDLLRQICGAWWALVPGESTARLAWFELSFHRSREMLMPDAVTSLLQISVGSTRHPSLAVERERIETLWDAWERLNESAVLERSRKL